MKKRIIAILILANFFISCTTITNKVLDVFLNNTNLPKDSTFTFIQWLQKMTDTYDAKKGYDLKKYSYKGVLFYNLKKSDSKNAVVYVHGGGFLVNYVNSTRFYFVEDLMEKSKINFETILVDMKGLQYPIQNMETEIVLKYIMKKYDNVVVVADSAGGNIALSTLLKMRDEGHKMPDGLVLLSPFTDFSNTVESRKSNFSEDLLFGKKDVDLLYNNPYIKNVKDVRNPYISPVYGTYEDFPKTLIQCSEEEVLRDDSVVVYNKMRKHGIDAKLEIYKGVVHAFQLESIFNETNGARKNIVKFLEGIYRDKGVKDK